MLPYNEIIQKGKELQELQLKIETIEDSIYN